ncbi:hypothetical protein OPT61_g5709 [Boeremia exigua]|uniref:Uncharacterized protein n=1 Tax=Boeremia exigua TaxID=749465 RepID=A0ACC2I9E6_9PLEO|nr:hypothetical protein OPT61_g5709 [Boeremia exigua]
MADHNSDAEENIPIFIKMLQDETDAFRELESDDEADELMRWVSNKATEWYAGKEEREKEHEAADAKMAAIKAKLAQCDESRPVLTSKTSFAASTAVESNYDVTPKRVGEPLFQEPAKRDTAFKSARRNSTVLNDAMDAWEEPKRWRLKLLVSDEQGYGIREGVNVPPQLERYLHNAFSTLVSCSRATTVAWNRLSPDDHG